MLALGLCSAGAWAADGGVARADAGTPRLDGGTADAGGGAVDAGARADAGDRADIPGEWPDSAVPTDVIDTALQSGEFTGFLKAVAEADLAETLKGPGPFTVLAPSDAAFAKLKGKELSKLLADKDRLKRFVRYHVILGRLSVADLRRLKAGDRLPTLLEGKKLKLGFKKEKVMVDKATVQKGDLEASNGWLHVLDVVLAP